MAGCLVGPKDCNPTCPEDDPTSEEEANIATLRDFVASIWNHRWTRDDEARCNDGDYLPPAVSDAIDRLVTKGYVRHRGELPENRTTGCGRDEFKKCVRKVHDICGDIQITVIGLIPKGDLVTVLVTVEGTDTRPAYSTQGSGVLDRDQPSGRPFRAVAASVYRFNDDHKIAEDWNLTEVPGLLAQLEGGQPARSAP